MKTVRQAVQWADVMNSFWKWESKGQGIEWFVPGCLAQKRGSKPGPLSYGPVLGALHHRLKWRHAEWSLLSLLVCVYVHVCVICVVCAGECRPTPAAIHAWRSQDNFWASILSFHGGFQRLNSGHEACAQQASLPVAPSCCPLPSFISHNYLHAHGHIVTGKDRDARITLTIVLSSSMGPATWQLELQLSTQEVHAGLEYLLPDLVKLASVCQWGGKDKESL